MTEPFIVTLQLDAENAEALNVLRRAHFPAERNFLDAHITLFHALPGDEEEAIKADLRLRCAEMEAFDVFLSRIRFTGRGVALSVESAELSRLRAALAQQWNEYLTPQDRQGYRPHVTLQNKVPPETARTLYERLLAEWTPKTAHSRGLELWRYRGGPWEKLTDFPFPA